MFYFSIYELILIVTFKLFDSTKIDTLNAIKKFIDQSQVHVEFKKDIPNEFIDKFEKFLRSKEVMIDKELQDFGLNILNLCVMYNKQEKSTDEFRCILKLESLEVDLIVKKK